MFGSLLGSLRPLTVCVIKSPNWGRNQLPSHFFSESVKMLMRSTLGRRVFLAHLQLSYRLGRRVTLAEFGRRIAERLGRKTPFAATAVSRWEAGLQIPAPEVIEAIAELSGVDPGWISHGEKSAAPGPQLLPTELPTPDPTQLPSGPARSPGKARAEPQSIKPKKRGR
jgi:transcriptional regulator with XRE-family HTH domain